MDAEPGLERRFWGGGTFILPQKVQHNGTAVSIDFCGFLNTEGTEHYVFRFLLEQLRERNDGILARERFVVVEVGDALPAEGQLDKVYCETERQLPNNGFDVQEGDQFAVFIYNGCRETNYCPIQINLINNNSCEGSLFQPSNGLSGNIDNQLVTAVQVEANIKISISKSDY